MTSITIRSTPVVVEWLETGSQQTCCLAHSDSSPVSLALFADPISCTAFLRVRAMLDLEDTCEQTAFYTMIPPEHITSLTVQPCRVPEVSSSPLSGLPALGLHLSMSEPATIVGPAAASSSSPKPKTAADSRLLASLGLLGRLHSLVLYIKEDAFPESTPQVLSNISNFKSSPKHADLKCLYEGRGGWPVSRPALETLVQATNSTTDSPPAYNDTKVETQLGSNLRKRQRRGEELESKDSPEAGGSSSVVDRLVGIVGRLEARLAHMETELQQVKARAVEHTESLQELQDAHDKATDELDDLSAHVDDYVVIKMDDYMDFVKVALEEFVEDKLVDVEDRVMDRVRTATISLSLDE
ncbi:hypothetical protein DHEL01_v212428 [Diaporthe helianthi]|uniref:Uncharacterized protein n=1 Tax=Diaporthe helianthi TaxID=158607 RepID=A0A2P5HG08_DIAHE|nr:hypothetical protein DHEL01_v212428 [Diaporthe helianthi]